VKYITGVSIAIRRQTQGLLTKLGISKRYVLGKVNFLQKKGDRGRHQELLDHSQTRNSLVLSDP